VRPDAPGRPGDAPRAVPVEARLRELRARHGDRVPLGEVGALMADLIRSMRGDPPAAADLRLYGELEALARYIEEAKREISSIRCDDIPAKHIPAASGELDAIGSHLEEATGTILDACEGLEAAARRAGGETEAAICDIVTRVYEACSFQDITGQRITKIVKALQTIEERVGRLVAVLGRELGGGAGHAGAAGDDDAAASDRDARLLNGPQAPGAANSQADIDALLAALDR
jgi:chemotaxis protein CheZ